MRKRFINAFGFLLFQSMVESVVEQNFLSSFHGMISSYHDMISSYHAVFGLRHRDKSAKVIGLSRQTRGKRFHYRRLFTANVYDGGCKRLQWRVQTFTMAGANVYNGGCKRLRWRMQTFTGKSTFFWGIGPYPAHVCSHKYPTAPEKSLGERLRSCPTWSGNLSCEQWPADKRGRRQGPRLSSCDIPDWDDRHPLTDNLLPRTRPLQNRDSFHWAVWER